MPQAGAVEGDRGLLQRFFVGLPRVPLRGIASASAISFSDDSRGTAWLQHARLSAQPLARLSTSRLGRAIVETHPPSSETRSKRGHVYVFTPLL